MMKFLRKHVKTFLWGIAVMFIGGIFLINYGSKSTGNYIAKVNGERIPFRQYQFIVYHQIQEMRGEDERELTEDQIKKIKQDVLGALIEESIMQQEARRAGLRVSDKEVVGTIYSLPQFQKDGKFHPSIYRQVLSMFYRTDPAAYEKQIEKGILIRHLKRLILESVRVTEREVEMEYSRRIGNMDNFEKDREQFSSAYVQEKQIFMFNQWLARLKATAKVINKSSLFDKDLG